MVRPKPDQPDRFLRPWESSSHLKSSENQEIGHVVSERDKLIEEQMKDPEVARLAQEAVDNDEL